MAKQILLAHGARKKIIKGLNTTYPTIREALRFKFNTEISQKIRKLAIENGGKLVEY